MIRPVTCICMVLAGASGLYLYQEKHRAQMLDREIASTMHAAQAARERSGVLQAEWTLLNDPERLAQLADRFLTLKTVTPGQFTTLAELDKRLPPVRQPDAAPADATPPDTTPADGEDAVPVSAMPAAGAPKQADPAPLAKAEPTAPKPDRARLAAAPKPVLPDKLATATQARPAPEHTVDRRPAFTPRIAAIAENRSVIRDLPLPRPPVAPVAFAPAPPSAPIVGSVLGMTRTSLPAPVPFLAPQIPNGGG